MKLALVLSALVALSGIAAADELRPVDPYAQQQVRPDRRERRERHQMRRQMRRQKRIQKLIRKFDVNHDGIVDQGEMPPRLARKLQKLDRNGDGWLDASDLAAPAPRRR